MSSPHGTMTSKQPAQIGLRQFAEVFQYSLRAFQLVWTTSRFLTVMLVVLTVAAGLMPAGIAYLGKLIVDAVVHAASYQITAPGTQFEWLPFADDSRARALFFVAAEGVLVALAAGVQRGIMMCQSLLRALLGQRVNVMILEKALTLTLPHFEDSEFYDKLTRARREASSRPLSLVNRTFGLIQNLISLVAFGGLLFQFSGAAVAILALAGLPAFFAEARFSGEAFRLFRWRSPEARQQMYLETILAREDHAKEVKLFEIGRRLLDRYHAIFQKLYPEDRSLTLRRGFWGYLLGLVATAAFYFVYGWIVMAAISRSISLGEMTLYLVVFRQGQAAVAAILSAVGGMYEDNLYLSNLYEFLEQEIPAYSGTLQTGSLPGDGVRFENVAFTYPGAVEPAIKGVSFHLKPGRKLALVGQNGSGKTTLIKLLAGLYQPSSGRILIDGTEIRDWDLKALHRRIAVIFQDFGRYQLTVGENVGAGDDVHFENELKWDEAAAKGMAKPFIDEMPAAYKTQLGTWFKGGRELSGGQWQKVALSRLFIREGADILVLDEPTAAMDAESEFKIFEHFRQTTQGQMAILISHRFSTVRMADEIAVLEGGQITEFGSHDELMKADGQYAKLFRLQAKGYQ